MIRRNETGAIAAVPHGFWVHSSQEEVTIDISFSPAGPCFGLVDLGDYYSTSRVKMGREPFCTDSTKV